MSQRQRWRCGEGKSLSQAPRCRAQASPFSSLLLLLLWGAATSVSAYSLQQCAVTQEANTYGYWIIACGGADKTCKNPYCPLGFMPDPSRANCTIKGMESPQCTPATTTIRAFGPDSWSVDYPYRLEVYALESDGSVSTEEHRPVGLEVVTSTGQITSHSISLTRGKGALNVTHTVAEGVTMRLSASAFGYSVELQKKEVSFVAGMTTKYTFAQTSVQGTVDGAVRLSVSARDQFNNVASHEHRGLALLWKGSEKITLANWANGAGSAMVRSTQVGVFTASMVDAAHATADTSQNATVTFQVGRPSRFRFRVPTAFSLSAGAWGAVPVVVEDQYGHVVTDAAAMNVTVILSKGSGGGSIGLTGGSGSAPVRHTVAEAIDLSFSDSAGTGLDASDRASIRISAAAASKVSFVTPTTSATADSAHTVSLRALDEFGNLNASADFDVDLRTSGTGTITGAGKVQVRNGEASVAVGTRLAQTVRLSLVDAYSSNVDCSAALDLVFAPGRPTRISLSAGAGVTVGESVVLSLNALDAYGNVAVSSAARVALRVNGSAAAVVGDGSAQLRSGAASANVTSTSSGIIGVTMEDAYATGLDVSAQATAVFLPAAPERFAFASTGPLAATVDAAASVDVQALDRYGNVADSFSASVSVRASAGASVANAGAVAIAVGKGTAQVRHTSLGSVELTLADSAGTGLATAGAALTVDFGAGRAQSAVLEATVTSGTVDAPLTVSLRALDQYGNLAKSFGGVFEVRQSGAHTLNQDVTFSAGVATASIGSRTPGRVDIVLFDKSGAGLDVSQSSARLSLTFAAGVPAKVAIAAPTSARAGEATEVNLTATDQYGNVASASRSIAVALVADKPAASIENNGAVELRTGAATVKLTHTAAETLSLSLRRVANADALDVSDTRTLVIRAGLATRYAFAGSHLTVSVDDDADVRVHALDRFGNVADEHGTDVGVKVGAATPERVAISSGRGTLRVVRTAPVLLSLTLADILSTGLDVSGTFELRFTSGAARTLALTALDGTESTVDRSLRSGLTAFDRHGNVAIGENRSFALLATGSRIRGTGEIALASGRGEASIVSELPQEVRLSLRDTLGTGLDCSATLTFKFIPGELYKFGLQSATGTDIVVAKVNNTATLHAAAQDRFGNVITNMSGVKLAAELRPEPAELAGTTLSWTLSNGRGTLPLSLSAPKSLEVFVKNANIPASYVGLGLLADAAVDRTRSLAVHFRLDLVPPTYRNLKQVRVSSSEVALKVLGLSEPALLWCAAVVDGSFGSSAAAAPPPVTPEGTSDGVVFAALRGGPSAENVTAPSVSLGRVTAAEIAFTLGGLSAAETYAVRCAAADDAGNQLPADRILAQQLIVATHAKPKTTGGTSNNDDEASLWDTPVFIVPLVTSFVAVLSCLFAALFMYRARITLKKAMQGMSKVVPLNEAGAVLGNAFHSVLPGSSGAGGDASAAGVGGFGKASVRSNAGDATGGGAAALALQPGASALLDPTDSESDEEGSRKAKEEEEKLLQQALQLQLQLEGELQRRGVDAATAAEEGDDSLSEDSDNEGVLRDVKAYIRKNMMSSTDETKASDLRLPDLPLLLEPGDEQRLTALLVLAQAVGGGDWDRKLAAFDKMWADASAGGALAEARDALRAEQQALREREEQASKELDSTVAALERHPEEVGERFVDELAAEEEVFSSEANERLRGLHQVSLEWPEEEAAKLEELLAVWTERVRNVGGDKAERLKVRKDAATALREFTDEREEALDAELNRLEEEAVSKFDGLREERSAAWRAMTEKADAEAAALRDERTRLRKLRLELRFEAQELALRAALRLRRQIRDAAVEKEAAKDFEKLDRELEAKRLEIERLSLKSAHGSRSGDADAEQTAAEAEEMAKMKTRALAALQRAHAAAKRSIEEDIVRRQKHWHEILEERSRDRLKATQRRRMEEERSLGDEAAQAAEEAREKETRRRTTLILGAAHQAETGKLAVTATVRRGRVLMGLQSTAAEAVAEERLPRRPKPSAADASANEAPDESSPNLQFTTTAQHWQLAKRKLGEELGAAVGTVGDLLTDCARQQRAFLMQRQRREAFLAGMAENEDEQKEDLLDALEENMHREVRAARWEFDACSAEALVHRGEGEETGLGRRLAAITRDSDLLQKEDEIGERYERLRALVLGNAGVDESAQRRSDELDEEAARLEAEALQDSDSDGAGDRISPRSTRGADEELDVQRRKLEQRHVQRQRRREEALKKASELREENKPREAAELLSEVLKEETGEAGDDADLQAMQELGREQMLRRLEVLDADGEAQLKRLEARRAACRRRREAAMKQADALKTEGKDDWLAEAIKKADEAAETLAAVLTETDADLDVKQIAEVFAPKAEDFDASAIDNNTDAQRAKLEARLQARGRRRQDVARHAEELRLQGELREAVEAISAECSRDSDADFNALKDHLTAELEKGEGLDDDRLAQLQKLEARRAARKRRREAAVERAEELASEGRMQEAMDLAASAAEEESDVDVDQLKGLLAPRQEAADVDDEQARQRQKLEARRAEARRRKEALKQAAQLEKEGKVQEALELVAAAEEEAASNDLDAEALRRELQERQEALELARDKQRQKLKVRREARQQRRDAALTKAQSFEAQGQVKEALAQIDSVADLPESGSDDEETVEGKRMLEDISKQVDELKSEGDAQRKRLEARKAAREQAKRRAQELEAQGKVQEALEVMRGALQSEEVMAAEEDGDVGEEEKRGSLLDKEGLQASLAAGADMCDADLFAKKRRMEERRKGRSKRKEEAMAKASALKKEAASLRLAAGKVVGMNKLASSGSDGAAASEAPEEIDPIAAWQAESRSRAAGDGVSASCQKGQEDAARRLLDGSQAEEKDAAKALKESFEQDMERQQAAVASEREAQRKRAQERLQAQRRRREEEKEKQAKASSDTAARVKRRFRFAFHGVGQLRKLYERRRAKMLQEHQEIERRVRAEVEAELKALQASAQQAKEAQSLERQQKNVQKSREMVKEEHVRDVRDAGKLRHEEAQSDLERERKRQAELIEQKLAKRKQRLQRREEKVKQAHAIEETQGELAHMQNMLQAKPADKSKNSTLVKELGQVNALISKLQNAKDQKVEGQSVTAAQECLD
eukprot:TRINITY_DN2668_c0_g4_i2.p1 TRINITY_DN2668_c0_g4~~TRINITY_DN2668_c0_g4_i2.p1  ORF type:complete len:3129 (+),score=942.11 TRINITY_DN2668_c0_g4_i2:67-9453(+)